MTSSFH
jgi:hypothetical protein